MKLTTLFFTAMVLVGCSALDKDNEAHEPTEIQADVKTKLDVYRPLVIATADAHGLVRMNGSIGDSALFSCLARVAGAASFDPAILFENGKPIRHPEIAPDPVPNAKGKRGTPISKDMVNGIMWCLYDLHKNGDTGHANELVSNMIQFGKDHKAVFGNGLQLGDAKDYALTNTDGIEIGWLFCTEQDKSDFEIDSEDWYGKCFMPPGVIKDIYRIAKLVGVECDSTCQEYMVLGPNLPSAGDGFRRHLGVIGTVRNGFVEGAINDNSLKIVLKDAREAEPRNAIYQGAYHTFVEGDQSDCYAALNDEALFPKDHLPTAANYCTDYLYQRDDDSKSGRENPDWLPCGDDSSGSEGRGVEFAFAAALCLGEVH